MGFRRQFRGFRGAARKPLLVISCLLIPGLLAGSFAVRRYWPYGEAAVRSQLAAATTAQVRFGSFHTHYLPPGCVAENVVFEREPSPQPLVTVARLTIESSFAGLFRRHVRLIRAQGLHLAFDRSDFSRQGFVSGQTTIDRFLAENSELEILAKVPEHSLKFLFQSVSWEPGNGSAATSFSAVFENPLPAGIIRTSGRMGAWNSRDPGETAVSGRYSLERADLAVFHGIGGLISSQGEFHGSLRHLEVEGSTSTPAFEVANTEHRLPLETQFSALVDATSGDTILRHVKGRFGRDQIEAQGTITRGAEGKRAAVLDLSCEHGRIEDTFYPFIHSPRSPLEGAVAFRMHVILPSGHEPFLRKLRLDSDFRMEDARFTRVETQSRVTKMGDAPGQRNPPDSSSRFNGRVQVRNGIAQFANLSVQDGGALVSFRGSYGLIDERVNLHGTLKTEASLSKTTHGIKSVFAKALEPFFKKRPHQTIVPVKIGGTYHHPNFGLDIT